jgi:hypothetical protein
MTRAHEVPGAGRCSRPDLAADLPSMVGAPAARRAEFERHAASCPECGPRVQRLARADAWIERRLAPRTASVCPTAEELFDYGRGPGAQPVAEAERLAIRAHVTACSECSAMLETLAHRPPAPLFFDQFPGELTTVNLRRRSLRVLIPLAAAAAIVAWLLWHDSTRGGERGSDEASLHIRFPADPPLRGQESGDLRFPRHKLLRVEQGLWSPLAFELAPRESATSYRVVLWRNDGGAFDAGNELTRIDSSAPRIDSDELPSDLEAGHYTWEAWATVDGLLVNLGRRDFEVTADAGFAAELASRESATDPARSESILHLLHERGFESDARAFARTLPPSPERDAYLARPPAR